MIGRNRPSRERLEHNLRIGEDGPTNKDFDPETSISRWYNEKVWRAATAKPHNVNWVFCLPIFLRSRFESQIRTLSIFHPTWEYEQTD